MGENEAKAVFAGASQNLSHGRRDEVMKLVDVEPEVATLFLAHALPAHCQLLEFRHKQGTKQKRILLTDLSLRKLRQKDFAVVQDVRKIQTVRLLRDHVANRFGTEKCFETRED